MIAENQEIPAPWPAEGYPPKVDEQHDVMVTITTTTSGKPEYVIGRINREMELLLGEGNFTLTVTPW